jgi:hypothetical protein
LQEFCSGFLQEPWLFQWLALAAGSLCREYVGAGTRLDDADRMNRIIRQVARMRGEQRVVRYSNSPDDVLPIRTELVQDDLRTVRLELAETSALLIPAFVRAGRDADASALLDEIERVSPRGDTDFAALWAIGVAQHANASAAVGRMVQVPKALAGIMAIAAKRPGDVRFPTVASWLALNTLKRTDGPADPLFTEMFDFLERTSGPDANPPLIADYAEGTLIVCTIHQQRGAADDAVRVAAAAAWALRSNAARGRWLERGAEAAEAIEQWVEGILALSDAGAAAPNDVTR